MLVACLISKTDGFDPHSRYQYMNVEQEVQAEQNETARRKGLFTEWQNSDHYRETILTRLKINDACNNHAEARSNTWNLCARPDNPAEGCIFFIENFGFTFDPRPQANPNHLPFVLFDYQKDAIRWLIAHIDEGKDGFIEKSRDMGISWVVFVWVPIWYWLFRDGVNILVGSYKEALVDNGTKDSLFGMIDYSVDSLPVWLLPKGFSKKKHRTQMKLRNPVTENLITGDTMNPDFGRGSRKTVILFDELGTWDYARDAWESAGDSTACRIANSTPKGWNYYAMLRETNIDKITLHWSLHPLKDNAWYEFEKTRRTEEEVAQELDISYTKSQEGRVYMEWSDQNVTRGPYPYDPNLTLYVGWDFGRSDDTAIIWVQVDPRTGRLRVIDTYKNNNKLIDFYVPFITGIMPSDGYKYTKKDIEKIESHRGWHTGTHFGDPAGRFRNQVSNETVMSVLKDHGIHVNFNDSWKEFEKRKTAAKLLMRKGVDLNDIEDVKYFDMCIAQASYPKVKQSGVEFVNSKGEPKHNWTSHYRSAFEYLALGLAEVQQRFNRVVDRFPKKEENKTMRRRVIGY